MCCVKIFVEKNRHAARGNSNGGSHVSCILKVIDGFGNEPEALSIGQSLSAFCASSLKNVSAVGSLHSLSEAMLLLSLTLFGLVSSEHFLHLLESLSEACCFSSFLRFYTMTLPIIYTNGGFCQVFF